MFQKLVHEALSLVQLQSGSAPYTTSSACKHLFLSLSLSLSLFLSLSFSPSLSPSLLLQRKWVSFGRGALCCMHSTQQQKSLEQFMDKVLQKLCFVVAVVVFQGETRATLSLFPKSSRAQMRENKCGKGCVDFLMERHDSQRVYTASRTSKYTVALNFLLGNVQ